MTPARMPLAGRRILVTRPQEQAGPLCRLIEAAGGSPVRFPVLEIAPAPDPAALAARLDRLADYDYAIFVSANAVRHVQQARAGAAWPDAVKVIAVGQRTAATLAELGMPVDLVPPSPYTSEALLALPDLQSVAGCSIVVFRGAGGRELIHATLTERGAVVDDAAAYQRRRPVQDASDLLDEWQREGMAAVTVASLESLDNLLALMGERGRSLVATTPLVVPGERVALRAREVGCEIIVPADNATDAAMVAALEQHFSPGNG